MCLNNPTTVFTKKNIHLRDDGTSHTLSIENSGHVEDAWWWGCQVKMCVRLCEHVRVCVCVRMRAFEGRGSGRRFNHRGPRSPVLSLPLFSLAEAAFPWVWELAIGQEELGRNMHEIEMKNEPCQGFHRSFHMSGGAESNVRINMRPHVGVEGL